MKVKLWTGLNGAGPVGEAALPSDLGTPKVIVWNDRVFVHETAGRYVEAVACILEPAQVRPGIDAGGARNTAPFAKAVPA